MALSVQIYKKYPTCLFQTIFLTAWDRVNVKKKEYFCSYEKKYTNIINNLINKPLWIVRNQ